MDRAHESDLPAATAETNVDATTVNGAARRLLTIKEVAAALSVSPQWLTYWLVQNPVDEEGVPFYIRPRTRRKFEPKDIDRIIAHMRILEAASLGLSGQSKARLAGLLSQVGTNVGELPKVTSATVLAELAARSERRPRVKRVRLPRKRAPTE